MTMKKTAFALLILALVPGLAWTEQRVDETRDADADARIDVEIVSGSLEITGWDRNQVRVTGTIGDDVRELEVSGSGSSISIDLDVPDSWGRRRRDIDARLEISIPAGARLSVETVSADVRVEEVTGSVELASVSGTIKVSGSPARAEVETVSGDIEVAGRQTAISAESVSGDIELTGAAQTVDASSVSGDIEVSAGDIERATFESVSGDLDFAGGLTAKARLHAEAHSGNTTLRLPADTSATWEVETFSGNVSNDFGPGPQKSSEHGPGKWLKFTTGSGDARITVESFSGNVRLEKR
jgi:DUF4097 and DUF4098 domain-containing protein YvlB